jgi:hypothetical protein
MRTSPPPPPPYGALTDLARKGTGITVLLAARRAGVSKATWIDNVRGYRWRDERWEPVHPKPDTIARMAAAVRISPERLATEGERPDAAEILREILRQGPGPEPPAITAVPEPAAGGDAAAVLLTDPVEQAIWRQTGKPEETRAREIRAWRDLHRADTGRSGTGGSIALRSRKR